MLFAWQETSMKIWKWCIQVQLILGVLTATDPFAFHLIHFKSSLSAVLIACTFSSDFQSLSLNNPSFSAPNKLSSLLFSSYNFFLHTGSILLLPFPPFTGNIVITHLPWFSFLLLHLFPTCCSSHFCILHRSCPRCLDTTGSSRKSTETASAVSAETQSTHKNKCKVWLVVGFCLFLNQQNAQPQYRNKFLRPPCQVWSLGS